MSPFGPNGFEPCPKPAMAMSITDTACVNNRALRARTTSRLPLRRPEGPGKSKLDRFRPEIEVLRANGSTQKFIAKRHIATPGNFSKTEKMNGGRKPDVWESHGKIGTCVR